MKTDETSWDSNMLEMYGVPKEEFTRKGSDYFEFTHPADRQKQLDNISRSIENTITEAQLTGNLSNIKPNPQGFRLIRKDGSIRWVRGDAVTIVNDKGEPMRMLGILMDITNQKQLESQLLQAQKMEPIGHMTGGLTHEINNYLFTIQAYAELSQLKIQNQSEVLENLQKIQSIVKMASKLLKQMLQFGKSVSDEIVDLNPESNLQEILQLIRATARSNLKLISNILPSENVIKANISQFNQITVNLINNSIHALKNKTNGIIEVSLSDTICDGCSSKSCNSFRIPNQIVGCKLLSVKDNGMGMSNETKSKIFDPFYTTKKTGTGLGLSIVNSIVSDLNGIIEVESKEGTGTEFALYFPIIEGSNTTPASSKIEKPLENSDCSILIVDDWQLLTNAYGRYLEHEGYQVKTSNTVAKGMKELTDSKDIDLVITDFDMPDGNGLDFIREIRKSHTNLPIILLTGYLTIPELANEIITDLDRVVILHKPIELGELVREIQNMLAN